MDPAAGRNAWQAGHIPGAVYAHLDDDLARPPAANEGRHPLPDPSVFAATLGRLGITNQSQVVAYDDQGGAIAARLWWMLGWIGHAARFLLDGGLKAWEAAELPLESGATERVQATYELGSTDASLVVSTEEIVQWSQTAQTTRATQMLVDARAPARYRGEQEPIDPVAGHVPGAYNLPFPQLLDDAGRFRSAEQLSELFAQVTESPDTLVAMCGSGVTACHLLAGLAVTGHKGRLYVGSWSEWIRDPVRPVASTD